MKVLLFVLESKVVLSFLQVHGWDIIGSIDSAFAAGYGRAQGIAVRSESRFHFTDQVDEINL